MFTLYILDYIYTHRTHEAGDITASERGAVANKVDE